MTDPSPQASCARPGEAARGWGLYLVDQIAHRWGISARRPAPRYWFELGPSRETVCTTACGNRIGSSPRNWPRRKALPLSAGESRRPTEERERCLEPKFIPPLRRTFVRSDRRPGGPRHRRRVMAGTAAFVCPTGDMPHEVSLAERHALIILSHRGWAVRVVGGHASPLRQLPWWPRGLVLRIPRGSSDPVLYSIGRVPPGSSRPGDLLIRPSPPAASTPRSTARLRGAQLG